MNDIEKVRTVLDGGEALTTREIARRCGLDPFIVFNILLQEWLGAPTDEQKLNSTPCPPCEP